MEKRRFLLEKWELHFNTQNEEARTAAMREVKEFIMNTGKRNYLLFEIPCMLHATIPANNPKSLCEISISDVVSIERVNRGSNLMLLSTKSNDMVYYKFYADDYSDNMAKIFDNIVDTNTSSCKGGSKIKEPALYPFLPPFR